MEIESKLRVLRVLDNNPEWIDILKEALEVEREGIERHEEYRQRQANEGYTVMSDYIGWEWHEVHTSAPILNKLVTQKLLNISYSSRSSTNYRVRSPELVAEALERLAAPTETTLDKEMPSDLLGSIVGHGNTKSIVTYAIESEKPAHLLLSGPPASAKTLFLLELSRLPESYYCLAQTMTGAGLADVLFIYHPKYLLIDEIDRLSPDNVGVLNSLMAVGRITESKIGKTRSMELDTKVFAAGIRVQRLPKDLLSRFITLRFNPYTETQFVEVCATILSQEECNVEVARLIGEQVWRLYGADADVRKAVQVARLAGGDMVKAQEIIRVLKKESF